jgi:hypothetical protein
MKNFEIENLASPSPSIRSLFYYLMLESQLLYRFIERKITFLKLRFFIVDSLLLRQTLKIHEFLSNN